MVFYYWPFQHCISKVEGTFTNPILKNGADPYALLHDDGNYYFMATRGNWHELWRTDDLTRSNPSIQKLYGRFLNPGQIIVQKRR